MKPSRVIGGHIADIAAWRGVGETWREIEQRLVAEGFTPGSGSLRILYGRELARRRSPERTVTVQWLHEKYQAIKDLLDQGYEWDIVLMLIPPNFEMANPDADFARLIAEFKAIDRVRTPTGQTGQVASSNVPPAPSVLPTNKKVAVGETAKKAVTKATEPAPTAATADSFDQASKSLPHLLKTLAAEKRTWKLIPNEDPFESAQELRERASAERDLAWEVDRKLREAPEDQWAAIGVEWLELNRKHDQSALDFLHRFSDYKATFTRLHILSSSALACGAYVVVDAESDDTITLQGLNRPGRIEGLDEVPERIIIRENLSDEELLKIQEAYAADGMELGERTPVRRLAEALLVRGEFLRRDGWHEYATLVKLAGDNFPSPTLSRATRYDLRSKLMDIWPKLTGEEPVQDSEFERSRAIWHADPELEKRGEWT